MRLSIIGHARRYSVKPLSILSNTRPPQLWSSNITCCNSVQRIHSNPRRWQQYPEDIRATASLINSARVHNHQVKHLLTREDPTLDQHKAYQIAAAIRSLREEESSPRERVVGRKIGFTNKSIWQEYNVNASNWSYVYDKTLLDLTELAKNRSWPLVVDIRNLSMLEPRLEPEIVLGLAKQPASSMDDVEMLGCVQWIAHGFEVVQSIFPDWKFTAVDTTAAFALHGRLLVGPKVSVEKLGAPEEVLQRLRDFNITLHRDGKLIDEGKGSNVLGSPLKALRHLCESLEKDEYNTPLQAGEVVTTGTLTRAWSIGNDQRWSTELDGLDLPGLEVIFHMGGQ